MNAQLIGGFGGDWGAVGVTVREAVQVLGVQIGTHSWRREDAISRPWVVGFVRT